MIFLKRFKRFAVLKRYNHGKIRSTICINQICQVYLLVYSSLKYSHVYFRYYNVFIDITNYIDRDESMCCIRYLHYTDDGHEHAYADERVNTIHYYYRYISGRIISYRIGDSPNITYV
jgi:hypothetical protein